MFLLFLFHLSEATSLDIRTQNEIQQYLSGYHGIGLYFIRLHAGPLGGVYQLIYPSQQIRFRSRTEAPTPSLEVESSNHYVLGELLHLRRVLVGRLHQDERRDDLPGLGLDLIKLRSNNGLEAEIWI